MNQDECSYLSRSDLTTRPDWVFLRDSPGFHLGLWVSDKLHPGRRLQEPQVWAGATERRGVERRPPGARGTSGCNRAVLLVPRPARGSQGTDHLFTDWAALKNLCQDAVAAYSDGARRPSPRALGAGGCMKTAAFRPERSPRHPGRQGNARDRPPKDTCRLSAPQFGRQSLLRTFFPFPFLSLFKRNVPVAFEKKKKCCLVFSRWLLGPGYCR